MQGKAQGLAGEEDPGGFETESHGRRTLCGDRKPPSAAETSKMRKRSLDFPITQLLVSSVTFVSGERKNGSRTEVCREMEAAHGEQSLRNLGTGGK